jgi:hypothetical protein
LQAILGFDRLEFSGISVLVAATAMSNGGSLMLHV